MGLWAHLQCGRPSGRGVGERVAIDTTRFGSAYAVGKPNELEGVIVGHDKGAGAVQVRYDIDGKLSKSHWKHLRPVAAAKPWHPIETNKPGEGGHVEGPAELCMA